MKILLVDNGTSYIGKLEKLLSQHDFETIRFAAINQVQPAKYDAIILSGGHQFPIVGNSNLLVQESNLIKNSRVPIFGICYGFQIIAHTFGAGLKMMKSKEKGILNINISMQNPIFENIAHFQVFENHRWVVNKLPADIIELARSKDGIEAIKHKYLPIYGVQFHPEMYVDQTCGDEIMNNFLKHVKNRRQ